MITLNHCEVSGWEAAIRGMRNPMNSWDKSDTDFSLSGMQSMGGILVPTIGDNDLTLMKKLVKAGSDHRKFMRQIFVSMDITAPLYWWKEFDTYKVGTTSNSCSTMHTIHKTEFALKDFSFDQLCDDYNPYIIGSDAVKPIHVAKILVEELNWLRYKYLESKDKRYWYSIIQLLPSSYNQLRTVTMNYENLLNMYHARRNHKLAEWHTFCDFIKTLPYSELITGEE